ncbi:response regulator transcription factor [[Eubacterium] hominis]|uniref:response regulator transcription factor n=1 Tax=[Eubacterium] hominis TaxID=2764325 RepID=UPI003A4E50C8
MRVMIVDDDKLVCSSLKTILETKGVTIVAVGYDGNQAIELYHTHLPDVLLMDIRMENKNGVEASEQILKQHPDAKILFLTTFSDDEYIVKALSLGVKGYILKQNFDSIIPALEAVYQGQNVFNTEIISKLPSLLKQKHTEEDFDLTKREIAFIELVAKGLNNKEIASILFLSEGTVRNYLSSLLNKLDLRDRTQLAIFYYQHIK